MPLKLKKRIFQYSKRCFEDIYKDRFFEAVCTVPSNSSSNRSKYIDADTFLILQKEISTFSSLGGHIILGDDFNSGLGNKFKDYIMSDSNDFYP